MGPGFVRHLHPPRIAAFRARFSYTFCLGGSALFFFLMLCATGVLLLFHYQPFPERAAASVLDLDAVIPFGGLVRSLHYFAAQLMVISTVLHMVRVVVTGCYQPPRRFNWVVGMGLLMLTLLLDFSGYVLRWDPQGRAAGRVGVHLAEKIPWIGGALAETLSGGGPSLEPDLLRWYVWHCVLLPSALTLLCLYHFWRVRKDGTVGGL